jgi:hypothetical protein
LRSIGSWLIFSMLLGWAVVLAPVDLRSAQAQEGPPAAEPGSPPPPPKASVPTITSSNEPAAKEPPVAPKPDNSRPAAVAEDIPIYYVRDKEGRLVPLLGFSYEELLKFVEQQKAGGEAGSAQPRPYNLQQLVITGQAKGDHAELEAVYKLQLESAGWVELPLVGGGAVLREPEKYQGPGEHSLVFDAASGSYRVRLHGEAKSEHELTLKIEAPIKSIGAEHRLEMTLPAAAASKLSLHLPDAKIAIASHAGAATADIKSASGATEIDLLGLGGPLSFAWKETGASAASSPVVLEATGEVLARIDSRSVQFDVALSVRSFGAEFDHFHVKLPPGAQWVAGESAPSGYTVAASGDAAQQIVEVQLAQKTVGPVEVRIRAERAYDVTKPDETLELAGFEVTEAVPHRQWGHLAVAVMGDWQVTWGRRDRIQQVDELPESLRRKEVVAGFEYFGQPASLAVHITPRKTRISVEPEYVYFIESQQVRLEARLKYAIRGAKAFALDIGLPGWQIDEIGPAGTVDSDAALASAGPIVKVPLVQATAGDVELTFKAHRTIAADAERVELTLPTLYANVQESALVALVPADNVRLRPIDAELAGLRRETSLPGIKLPSRQQSALYYRGEQAAAKFVGEIQRMPQSVSAAVESSIEARHDELRVEQTIQYRVEHEPLTAVSLEVPAALLATDVKWELLLDGQPLTIPPPVPQPPSEPANAAGTARIEVPLPGAKIGEFEIQVRSHWPESAAPRTTNDQRTVPLIMPAGATLTSNTLTLSSEGGLAVQAHDPAWTEADAPHDTTAAGARPVRRLNAAQGATEITLAIGREDRHSLGDTVVDRAWVQTWLTGGGRQDRAVYRFIADQPLEIALPPGVSAGNAEARLDGQSVNLTAVGQENLSVHLTPTAGRQHVLELQYQFDDHNPRLGMIEAELPRFHNNVWVQRMYWQLVLPNDQHLMSSGPELTPEFAWDWAGMYWTRRAPLDQAELEEWTGVERETPPPEKTNRYVFSVAGNPDKLTVRTAERGQIVLLASLGALIVGLLLIYVPATRRPTTLLAAGVLLLALTAWNADLAFLLAQASVLGVALVVLAGLLERSIARRRPGAFVVRSNSSILKRSSDHVSIRPLEAVTAASSTSAADAMEEPATESEVRLK